MLNVDSFGINMSVETNLGLYNKAKIHKERNTRLDYIYLIICYRCFFAQILVICAAVIMQRSMIYQLFLSALYYKTSVPLYRQVVPEPAADIAWG